MSSTFVPTGKELPFANGRFLLIHRLGSGSFGDIFEGYDNYTARRVAVKLEKKKVPFPLLPYESKVYRILHQSARTRGSSSGSSGGGGSDGENATVAATQQKEAALQLVHGTDSSSTATTATTTTTGGTSRTTQQQQQLLYYAAVGVPLMYHASAEGDYNVLVMELCGPSLEELFNYCHRRFSLKTVLMLADQMLSRMEFIHDKGFVHRDIKPENFVMGEGAKAHIVYIIDFGLSKLYWYVSKNVHMPFAEGKSLTGTARYCSVNTHRGYEQSRRDDLESIGYLLIYFLRSSLPWQGMQARDQATKTTKIGEKKMSTPLEQLCKGLPSEFLHYVEYCRNLGFQERPNYNYLRGMFRSLGRRCGAARACGTGSIDNNSLAEATATALAMRGSQRRGSGWCNASGNNNNTSSSNDDCGNGGANAAALLNKSGVRRGLCDVAAATTTAATTATTAAGNNNNSHVHIVPGGIVGGGVGNDGAINDASGFVFASSDKNNNNNSSTLSATTAASAARMLNKLPASHASRGGSAAYFNALVHEGAQDAVGYYDWRFDWFEKRISEVDAAVRTRGGSGFAASSGGGGGGGAATRSGNSSGRGAFVSAAS